MTTIESRRLIEQVQVADGVARWTRDGAVVRELPIKPLPERFIDWQLAYKRRIYDAIEKDEYIRFNAGHLPVVGTWDADVLVPNLANKGVGFTPADEHLDRYLDLVESAVNRIVELPPHAVDETRALRVGTAREFYAHPEHIDWRRLGLLEIFEGEDRKSTRLNSSHIQKSRMPSSA